MKGRAHSTNPTFYFQWTTERFKLRRCTIEIILNVKAHVENVEACSHCEREASHVEQLSVG